jgi:hypothetical protein
VVPQLPLKLKSPFTPIPGVKPPRVEVPSAAAAPVPNPPPPPVAEQKASKEVVPPVPPLPPLEAPPAPPAPIVTEALAVPDTSIISSV